MIPVNVNQVFSVGAMGRFQAAIVKISGDVVSLLSPTVTIIRNSDNYIFDYAILTFVLQGTEINGLVPMVEQLPSDPGIYYYDFNDALYGNGINTYTATFIGTPYTDRSIECYSFVNVAGIAPLSAVLQNSVALSGDLIAVEQIQGTMVNVLDLSNC